MHPTDDNALLREFAENRSDEAFAELVKRHVNLVYSVALRNVGDPHHAGEIAQRVFIILAQKAPRLRHEKALSSWLFQATQLTANNFVRSEARRHRREQEAYMQSVIRESDPGEVWQQIAPFLDDAVAALGPKDRSAIVLRFYEGRNLREVGAALGANEGAAKMRVIRALEKLQKKFFRRGIKSTTETLAGAISAHSVQPAPVVLAKTITAAALAKGAVAGVSTLALTKTALVALTMKTKITVISLIVATVVIGLGLFIAFRWKAANVAYARQAAVTLPVKLPNAASRRDAHDLLFEIDVDPNMTRTSDSSPSIHIKGPIMTGPPQPPGYSDAAMQKAGNSSSIGYPIAEGSPLMGKRISITGWLKTTNVNNWAAAYMCIYIKGKGFSRFDGMYNRPLSGTTDWRQIELVTDVPNEPCLLFVGPDLYGSGEMWGDDFQIALADPDEPVTDDREWHYWQNPMAYTVSTDTMNEHESSPSICLNYTATKREPRGIFMWWGKSIRVPEVEGYLGHTLQMTGWVKTEDVSGHLQPTIIARAPNRRVLVDDSLTRDSSLNGTRNWTPFTVTCAVPKQTGRIDAGFIFWGTGKVWIDTNSLAFEIVK
jgi:RNA polymerase sigma factor (sigma-70 family)